MHALELGTKVHITITGQPEQAITNEVFLADALIEALPKLDSRVLHTIRQAVSKEALSRSAILANQSAI